MSQLSIDEQYNIITKNLDEVISEDEIKEILKKDGKLKIYWGTATTGKPHLGYFVPIFKISDYLKAGCEVTILLADLHGLLDNMKSEYELLAARTKYYEFIIRAMLNLIGVDQSKLRFVKGTDFQLKPEYTLDMYKLTTSLTTHHCLHAGAEVVKQVENPLMSNLLYPILQSLDEEYLGVNCQFGGVDQRKIFMFARTILPKIGYKPRVYLMNPIVPGLGKPDEVTGKFAKMSSSDPNSKVDFDDSKKVIGDKFKKAFSVDGVVENNGLLAILKYVVFRFLEIQNRPLVINRPAKWGGDLTFATYLEVESEFSAGKLASADIKQALTKEINDIVHPLREQLLKGAGKDLYDEAYPAPKKVKVEGVVTEATFACLDVRVGKILTAEKHPQADSLFVEKIDLGESEPRTIVSGLAEHYTVDQIIGKKVVVICNLPHRNMRGITSQGMVFAASKTVDEKKVVNLLEPHDDANPGDRVFVDGCTGDLDPEVKPKRWTRIVKNLNTNDNGTPSYKDAPLRTASGPLKDTSVKNGDVA
jgi:tyrosyl-tRNA synthetase